MQIEDNKEIGKNNLFKLFLNISEKLRNMSKRKLHIHLSFRETHNFSRDELRYYIDIYCNDYESDNEKWVSVGVYKNTFEFSVDEGEFISRPSWFIDDYKGYLPLVDNEKEIDEFVNELVRC